MNLKPVQQKRYSTIEEVIRKSTLRQALESIHTDVKYIHPMISLTHQQKVQLASNLIKPKTAHQIRINSNQTDQEKGQFGLIHQQILQKQKILSILNYNQPNIQEKNQINHKQSGRFVSKISKKPCKKQTFELCLQIDTTKQRHQAIKIQTNEDAVQYQRSSRNYLTLNSLQNKNQKKQVKSINQKMSAKSKSEIKTSRPATRSIKISEDQPFLHKIIKLKSDCSEELKKPKININNIDCPLQLFPKKKRILFNQLSYEKIKNNQENQKSKIIEAIKSLQNKKKQTKKQIKDEIPDFIKPSLQFFRVEKCEERLDKNIFEEIEQNKDDFSDQHEVEMFIDIKQNLPNEENIIIQRLNLQQKKIKPKINYEDFITGNNGQERNQEKEKQQEQIQVEVFEKRSKTGKKVRSLKKFLREDIKICGWEDGEDDHLTQNLLQ